MSNDHTHEHDHDHGDQPILKYDDDSAHDYDEASRYTLLAEALRQLLVEKEVIKANEVREYLQFMDSRGEEIGAKIIARAWAEPEFKDRLLANGNEAISDYDIPMLGAELVVVENTDDVHNVVVCTLCSCYPRTILGLPPDWYKSKVYRSRAVNEPRAVLREFGTELSDNVALRVHDSNADMRYLVMPKRPDGTDGWSQEQLEGLVTRDSMIGVTTVKPAA
ncbi:MAG: nitrile hydratase subunit alpha [Rhodospirillaceae bacterium]|jgi:nitrile hydratase alpha subunit